MIDLSERVERLEARVRTQQGLMRAQQSETIRLKTAMKLLTGKKPRVVFVCHRPAIWISLQSVWEAFNSDPAFETIIVTIPNKKQLPGLELNHEIYEDEGAWDFFRHHNCRVIKGYDEESGQWFDLKSLNPDVLFFQIPYDICHPPAYHSNIVSSYCRLAYVHYCMTISSGYITESAMPLEFASNISFHFTEHDCRKEVVANFTAKSNNPRLEGLWATGHPTHDLLSSPDSFESDSWALPRKNATRIMWAPRWTLKEKNGHFLEYKDRMLDYAAANPDVFLLFRPHPQAFSSYIAEGMMTKEELAAYIKRYDEMPNAALDRRADYIATICSSDILVADFTSLILDYFLTGKPVIYCHKVDMFNPVSAKIAEGYYWVNNWKELEATINMLKSGTDPLAEKRREIMACEYLRPAGGSGAMIKRLIQDALEGTEAVGGNWA